MTLIATWTSASGFAEDAYTIYRVIDGDTVVLQKNGVDYKIRLIGVDTPETVHPLKPVEWYGKEASHFLRNLLRGESVYLAYETKTAELDRYGRVLAYLYRAPDSLFVNLEIVRQGYGHAYTQYPFNCSGATSARLRRRERGYGLSGPLPVPSIGWPGAMRASNRSRTNRSLST